MSSTHKEKRQKKVPEASAPPKSSSVLPSQIDIVTRSAKTSHESTPQNLEVGLTGQRFSPSFVHEESMVLTLNDNVKAEPGIATTFL